jgi:heptosyltransferase-3
MRVADQGDGMRILFIGNTRIGDFILASGLIDHLLTTYPDSRLTIVCGAGCVALTRNIPRVDKVIVMRKRKYNRHWFDLWRDVVRTRWDLVVDLRNSGVSFAILSRETTRLQRSRQIHKVVEAGATLGLSPPPDPRLWIGDDDRASARRLVPEGSPYIVFGPGATLAHKTWPAERFAQLALRLTAPDGLLPGARVVLLGSPDERPAAEPTLRALPEERRVDLMDKADLLQAAAVIERAALYIGNDNGQMHLAAATGAPTLGLFGSTPAQLYGPWGKNCALVTTDESYESLAPLIQGTYTSNATLMDSLSVEKVAQAARDLLGR